MATSRSDTDPIARLRAWWLRRQGLGPATAPKTIEASVRQAGWLPTSGSTGVYLSIRARMGAASREAIDRAAIDGVSLIDVPGPHAQYFAPSPSMAISSTPGSWPLRSLDGHSIDARAPSAARRDILGG